MREFYDARQYETEKWYSGFHFFYAKPLFDFIKSCGGRIDLKFSGVALLGLLYSPKWKRSFFSKGKSTFLYGRLFTSSCSRIIQCERNTPLERGSFCLFYEKTKGPGIPSFSRENQTKVVRKTEDDVMMIFTKEATPEQGQNVWGASAAVARLDRTSLPWPPSCTCLMYAQLWSMPALSGMAPYVKRMPYERIQTAVARCILQAPWRTPKSELLQALDWPSLRWRREIASLCLLHRLLNLQQEPLTNCLPPFASSRNPRSQRKPRQLILPAARTTRHTTSFFFSASVAWNTLPAHISKPKQMLNNSEKHSPNTFIRKDLP